MKKIAITGFVISILMLVSFSSVVGLNISNNFIDISSDDSNYIYLTESDFQDIYESLNDILEVTNNNMEIYNSVKNAVDVSISLCDKTDYDYLLDKEKLLAEIEDISEFINEEYSKIYFSENPSEIGLRKYLTVKTKNSVGSPVSNANVEVKYVFPIMNYWGIPLFTLAKDKSNILGEFDCDFILGPAGAIKVYATKGLLSGQNPDDEGYLVYGFLDSSKTVTVTLDLFATENKEVRLGYVLRNLLSKSFNNFVNLIKDKDFSFIFPNIETKDTWVYSGKVVEIAVIPLKDVDVKAYELSLVGFRRTGVVISGTTDIKGEFTLSGLKNLRTYELELTKSRYIPKDFYLSKDSLPPNPIRMFRNPNAKCLN